MNCVDNNLSKTIELKIERTIKALEKNNMKALFAKTSEDAVSLVENELKDGDHISCGGSVSLQESGIKELMESGKYDFLDREKADDMNAFYKEAFGCDVFITSSNAVTEEGDLYNVDGNGNRVAMFTFGPKKMIVVIGYNKIVGNIDEAIKRVKTIAAPANGMRLNTETPCAITGKCIAVDGEMTEGCDSPRRMCRHYVTTSKQRDNERYTVIIVGEELGY